MQALDRVLADGAPVIRVPWPELEDKISPGPGHVILAIGDRAIDGVDTFVRLVNALPAGQEIPFTVLDHRDGDIGAVGVTLR